MQKHIFNIQDILSQLQKQSSKVSYYKQSFRRDTGKVYHQKSHSSNNSY